MRVYAGGLQPLNEVVQRAHERLEESWDHARTIVETVRESLVVLDGELRVKAANRSFYQTFRIKPDDIENRFIYELGKGQWNITRLREQLQEIIPQNSEFEDFKVTHEFPVIGRRTMRFSARRLHRAAKFRPLILLAVEDVSGRLQAEEVLAKADEKLRAIMEAVPDAIIVADKNFKIILANAQTEALFGYAHTELLGESVERLIPERSTTVFRILQEALTNVTRHAGATEVTISLFKRDGKLLLTVRDNGKGITASQSSAVRSLGLLGMRERVQHWGGKVKIKGRPNRGTVVFVSLPLAE